MQYIAGITAMKIAEVLRVIDATEQIGQECDACSA
jgi:hypothetical protein